MLGASIKCWERTDDSSLHCAITKSGTEIRNKGAPITGIEILSFIESGIGI